ncbi:hypothetical protein ASPACDRAFT_54843 [Aspergillus aculeatus ATCC 16872]|uniref:Fungal-type protein kinase domain-containing protein n=1 Tax=Aspergillus aculeatus (strain ATCC 16872 / CBS 172.66 / WB 5094) TaxID=690307 RepID=A0A1L9WIG7_ASPA1|nr:uncharacterized protein ASPACDRAFT_54843 [Aspergillus aculeatus ATCC 16872]OJJ95984.1 hypothetical protein ASPACDRAFT_54843 [Aspergillus aculeatus ATCC 16872]
MSLFKRKGEDKDADSFRGSFSIPASRSEWVRLATQSRLIGKSLHDLVKLGSGSKVTKKQFVLFRAVWPRPEKFSHILNDKAKYHLNEVWDDAEQLVAKSVEIQNYFSLVESPDGLGALAEGQPGWPGSWALVLKWQKRCPPNDEAVTNVALITFLDAVSNLIPQANFEVTIVRVAFEATFKTCSYKALTDGGIWIKDDIDDVRAIAEVKKGPRRDNSDRIRMQETAEIVGWLKSAKPWNNVFGGYKILFAQDGHQAWLVFGKPTTSYPAYLAGGTHTHDTFLDMTTYGPFKLSVREHIKTLCVLSAAVMLRIKRALQVQ